MRERILTTLAGTSNLTCTNLGGATLTLSAQQLQFGADVYPVSTMTRLVAGKIFEPNNEPGLSFGDLFKVQAVFESGNRAFELRFLPSGELADVLVGTLAPTSETLGSLVQQDTLTTCKPGGGEAWNSNPGLKISTDVSYATIDERAASYAAQSVSCRTLAGVEPQTWTAQVWYGDDAIRSTPRPTDSEQVDYVYPTTDYRVHYTVIQANNRVEFWDRLVLGGQFWGVGLMLGDSEQIVGMGYIYRAGAPYTQDCTPG